MRRLLAAAALAFLATPLHAGWTVFNFVPSEVGGFETSIVAPGRNPYDFCLAHSVVPIAPFDDYRGDIWCLVVNPAGSPEFVLQRRFITNFERASVAARAVRGDRVHWVISDP